MRVLFRAGVRPNLHFTEGRNVFDFAACIPAQNRAELYNGLAFSVLLMFCGVHRRSLPSVTALSVLLMFFGVHERSVPSVTRLPKELFRELGGFLVA
jgi:hypothetical protein